MKPVNLPRSLFIFTFVLVAVAFLTGTMKAFNTARAASATPTGTAIGQVKKVANQTPTPVPTPVPVSADTTGIIALAIIIVVIVLIGATLGGSKSHKKKSP
jgi:hypothetical protein